MAASTRRGPRKPAEAGDGPSARGGRLPRRGHDEPAFEHALRQFTDRTDPAFTWLGIVFALLVAAQFAFPTTDTVGRTLAALIWTLWSIFILDFLAKLWLAPRKLRFLRRHWVTVIGLLVPTLRVFSFFRLLRLGRALPMARALSSGSRAARSAGPLFRSRLGYLAGVASIGVLAIGELAYLFEDSGRHPTLPTFNSALLWAAASVIGMSPTVNPVTTGGQLTMIAAFTLGLITVSTLAATIGAYLLHPSGGDAVSSPEP